MLGRGMIKYVTRPVSKGKVNRFSTVETDQWFLWPRESEGNIYAVNWSLVGDGVTATGNAYRNARSALLTTKLSAKPAAGKVILKDPVYFGEYKLQEAGDESLSLESFRDLSEASKEKLSSESELYIEDASLGTFGCVRVGVRIVSPNPAMSMISRTLLVPVPPRECDHRAKYNGWNLDPLWQSGSSEKVWDGDKYLINENPTPAKGQRPIVAFVGADSNTSAVEFVQNEDKIVGANVAIGVKTPVRGIIEAVGHAATVIINEQQASSLALPSTSFTKSQNTCVVIGADDSVVDTLVSNKSIYGAYHNVVTESGVSACWNGVLGAASASETALPSVVVDGKSAISLVPNNLAGVATHFAFFEKGGKKGSLSEEEAAKKIIAIVGDSKSDLAAKLVKGTKCMIITSSNDLGSIL